jgi:capsular exopolysaccharide synthesis family protein
MSAGLIAAATRDPVYQASALLLVPTETSAGNSIVSGDPIAAVLSATLPNLFDSQVRVLQSEPFVEEAKQKARVGATVQGADPKVTVVGSRETNSIQVTVEGSDPHETAKLANTMVDLHLERMNSSSVSGFQEALEFARKERTSARGKVADAERRLLRFRHQHPGVGPSRREMHAGEFAALAARVPEIESAITLTNEQIKSVKVRLVGEPAYTVQEQEKSNPRAGKLQDKLDDLRLQRMDLLREYKPTSRVVRDLDSQIHRLQEELERTPALLQLRERTSNPERTLLEDRLQELQATLHGLELSRNTAVAQVRAQKAVIDELGPAEIQLERLIHNRDTAQAAYDSLSDRVQDLEVRSRAWQRLSRTTQAAARATVPGRPSNPLKSKLLVMILFAALAAAIGAALLHEVLDDRLTTPQQAHRQVKLPVFGQIPLIAGGHQPLLTSFSPDSPLAESYRSLRANLGFAAIGSEIRTVVITSAEEGEGKTSIAANLAIAMAMTDRCVILVDANLRSPGLHQSLELPQSPGLTDVLQGRVTVEEALCGTGLPGLLVLTSGTTERSPADLLSTGAMAQLLGTLRDTSDIVIIDTPRTLGVTDAQVLAPQVDAVLVVAEMGKAKRTAIRCATDLMDRAYARLLGLVLNRSRDMAHPAFPPGSPGNGRLVEATCRAPLPPSEVKVAQTSGNALKPGHALTYAALFLFSLFLWFRPYELFPALSSLSSMASITALLTLVVYFSSQLSLEGTLTARIGEVKLVLLLCAAALLSMLFAVNPAGAWLRFTDTYYKVVLIFIVLVNAVRNQRRLHGLILIALAVGVVLSVGVIQDSDYGRLAAEGRRPSGLIGGMFENPNDLAIHLGTMVALAVGLLLGARNPLSRVAYGIGALLMVAGTVVTYSRGGFLGLMAGMLFFVWKFGRRKPFAVGAIALAATIALFAFAPGDYASRVASTFIPGQDPTGTKTQRTELLIKSIAQCLVNPLFGIGMANSIFVTDSAHESHNSYTQVGGELGLPALCVYIAFLASPMRRLRQVEAGTRGVSTHSSQYYLAIGLQASLVSYMVSSFFASVAYVWYVYYLIAYSICLHRMIESEASSPEAVPPAPGQDRSTARGGARRIQPVSA